MDLPISEFLSTLPTILFWMSAGLVVFREIFTYFKPNKAKEKRLVWMGIRVALILSVVWVVWQSNERNKNLSGLLQADFEDRPKLRGSFDAFEMDSGKTFRGTKFIVGFSVKNAGSPSIVDEWHFEVFTKDSVLHMDPVEMPESLFLSDGPNRTLVVLARDALYRKTTSPVPAGGMVQGWLPFRADGFPLDSIPRNATINMLFTDVTGRRYVVRDSLPGSWTKRTNRLYPEIGWDW